MVNRIALVESSADPVRSLYDNELPEVSKRLFVALIFGLPLIFIAVLEAVPWSPFNQYFSILALVWIQLALATPVVLWAGWPVLVRGWRAAQNNDPNPFTLIALGIGVAFLHSVILTILLSLDPGLYWLEGFRSPSGGLAIYYEVAALITILVLLGRVLEVRARAKAEAAACQLAGSIPRAAMVLDESERQFRKPLENVRVGDRIIVHPGEKIPVDGIVLEGEGWVNESMFTGDPIMINRSPGELVKAGAVHVDGDKASQLIVQAQRIGQDTHLSKFVQKVSEAQSDRTALQRLRVHRLSDRASSFLVPGVVIVSAVTFLLWAMFGPEPRFVYGILNAIAVLVVACPAAFTLAVPMSVTVATGRAALSGILVKNPEVFELLNRVDTLIVDEPPLLTRSSTTADAFRAMTFLKNQGLSLVLMTGDQRDSAKKRASALGIEEIFAEIKPDEKVPVLKRLIREGRTIALIADGVNDIHALSEAHVGITLGTGSDSAFDSADIVLAHGGVSSILQVCRLGRLTFRNIKQNLFFALIYNVIAIPIAAGLLYPFEGFLLSPVIAGAAMTLGSISVVSNALRLRKIKL